MYAHKIRVVEIEAKKARKIELEKGRSKTRAFSPSLFVIFRLFELVGLISRSKFRHAHRRVAGHFLRGGVKEADLPGFGVSRGARLPLAPAFFTGLL